MRQENVISDCSLHLLLSPSANRDKKIPACILLLIVGVSSDSWIMISRERSET